MRVSAYRDVRWMDVLIAEALTLDPNGSRTECWALANATQPAATRADPA